MRPLIKAWRRQPRLLLLCVAYLLLQHHHLHTHAKGQSGCQLDHRLQQGWSCIGWALSSTHAWLTSSYIRPATVADTGSVTSRTKSV